MSEMVERVAKALWESEGGDWPIADAGWRADYFDKARAAIAALRKPTEAMFKAAAMVDRYADPGEQWAPMVDAALSGECPEYDQAMEQKRRWLAGDPARAEAPAE